MPLTPEQIAEAGVQLRAHHIVARLCDAELFVAALRKLPRRRRPTLDVPQPSEDSVGWHDFGGSDQSPNFTDDFLGLGHSSDEHEAMGTQTNQPCSSEAERQPEDLFAMLGYTVEHTFYTLKEKDVSQASNFTSSAPAGTTTSRQPQNPRVWNRTRFA